MKVQLDDTHPDHYIEVEPSLYGLALVASVDGEEYAVLNLNRPQAVELIVNILKCFEDKEYHKKGISLEAIENEMLRQSLASPGWGRTTPMPDVSNEDAPI